MVEDAYAISEENSDEQGTVNKINVLPNQSMGALKEVWRNPHLDTYSKYLLFRAIPMNLILWISPLGKLGHFESAAEIFLVYIASISLASGPIYISLFKTT